MLLIWRTLNDRFSYKNGVNSNNHYLALLGFLFIYRDETMALAWTSGVCFLVNTPVIGAAEDTTALCLLADPPAHEWMVNSIFVKPLAAAHNDCPCRNCSFWYRYAHANETRSAGVQSQLIWSYSIQPLASIGGGRGDASPTFQGGGTA